MLNYFTKQVLIEIDKNEISKVKTENLVKNSTRNVTISLIIGASVLIGYLVKPLGDYLDFSTTYTLNIILILIAIVPILLIKSVVYRNKKIKLQLYLKKDTFRTTRVTEQ
ncbi:tandem five-transmembrane protein [Staphylococcus hominis]|nr:tandem five-transmembrane protein [Staphylococcus hominis]